MIIPATEKYSTAMYQISSEPFQTCLGAAWPPIPVPWELELEPKPEEGLELELPLEVQLCRGQLEDDEDEDLAQEPEEGRLEELDELLLRM